ncbi:protein-lysine N-methyltransferase EEF2KMT isoform X2 [Bos taurus]|uniref:protein-lysine N-methyltransferase EEF2KMT isoform X2 n=1 Tax=Bos taurus TaxID=9913 RepID=UPI000D53ADA1|nr:protein-lysine N-methyltransferase EEF2KMT isoform X2 [Bos taurus]
MFLKPSTEEMGMTATVKHPLCVKHPPSVKYSRSFLSELIRKHEAVHTEPLDELYQALAEVLTAEDPTHCHRSYLLPSGDSVTLCESTAIVSHGTTGLVTWNAALYLAEWAVENPAVFAHRMVLELGSGAGLTGLAICKTCRPRAYIFSDCHSHVLEQLRGNVLLNGFSLEPSIDTWAQHPGPHTPEAERPWVTVARLDWDTVTAPQLAAFQPDVVLAAGTAWLSAGTQQWTLPGGKNGGTWVAWASRVTAQHGACLLGALRPQPPRLRQRPCVLPRKWSLLWRNQLCPARRAMSRTGPRAPDQRDQS